MSTIVTVLGIAFDKEDHDNFFRLERKARSLGVQIFSEDGMYSWRQTGKPEPELGKRILRLTPVEALVDGITQTLCPHLMTTTEKFSSPGVPFRLLSYSERMRVLYLEMDLRSERKLFGMPADNTVH